MTLVGGLNNFIYGMGLVGRGVYWLLETLLLLEDPGKSNRGRHLGRVLKCPDVAKVDQTRHF